MSKDLREFIARYKPVLEELDETVFVLDLTGKIVYANETALKRYLYTNSDLGLMSFRDIVCKEYLKVCEKSFKARVRGKHVPKYRIKTLTKRGEVRHCEISGNEIQMNGSIVGALIMAKDVSSEEKTLVKADFLSKAIETAPYSFMSVNLDGRIEYVNREFEKLYGYSRKEIIGKNASLLNAEPEAVRIKIEAEMSKAVLKGGTWTGELLNRKKNGEEFHASFTVYSIKDDSGSITRFVGFLRDITSRKQMTEAIKAERDKANTYLDIANVMMVALDSKGIVTMINRKGCKILGYREGGVVGKNWFDNFLPKKRRGEVKKVFKNLMAGKLRNMKYYENPVLTKSGGERLIAWNNTLLTSADGKNIGTLSSGQDITESRRSEEALRESLKTSDDIVKTIPSGLFIYRYVAPDKMYLESGNSEAQRLTGLKVKDWAGREFNELWPNARRDGITSAYLHAFKTGKTFETEELHYTDERLDGAFRIRAFRLPGDKLAVAFENVTAKMMAEQALRMSESKYRELFDRMLRGVAVYSSKDGVNFIIKDINKSGERISKVKKKGVVGRNVMDVFPGIKEFGLLDVLSRVWKTGKSEYLPPAYYEDERMGHWGDNFVYKLPTGEVVSVYEDLTEKKRSEEALIESEEKFRSLAENSPNMIFINVMGRIVYVNHKCVEIMGYSKDEFYSKKFNFRRMMADKDQELVEKAFRNHMAGKDNEPLEYTIVTKNGKEIDVILSTELIDFMGEKAILGVVTDITERKKFEEKLADLNVYLHNILQNAPVGILTIDDKGGITSVNNALIELLGSPSESDTLKFNVFKLPQLKKQGIDKLFRKVLNGGTINLDSVPYTSFWGKEIIVDFRSVPLKDSHGSVTGAITILDDVTEKTILEREISDMKEHLETVINSMDESIVVLDRKYRIISHNKAFEESLRKKRKSVRHLCCFDVIHGKARPCKSCVVREMFKTGKPVGDIHYHHEPHGRIYHEVRAYPLKDSAGNLIQAVYVFRDVTEREVLYQRVIQAKEAAESLVKMKSDFVSVASHELKTPLAIIRGYAELLSTGMIGRVSSQQKEKIDKIIGNIDRMNALVSRLLDLHKLESGEVRMSLEKKDVRELVESVLSEMENIIKGKGIKLKKMYSSKKKYECMIDATLLKQVVFNVVDNAIKFTPSGGNITVSIKKDARFINVSLSDTGIGIPRKELDKIGQRFYQVDSSVSRRYKGAGLGLAICKRIISLHKGVLDIKSSYGKGTKVSFKIPESS
ncbi:MAG: PAS domain S-box protein [Candidatus Altiarchaeota archaeon]